MARRNSSSLFVPRGDSLFYLLSLVSLIHHISLSTSTPVDSHFEGFDADDFLEDEDNDIPLSTQPPPKITLYSTESHHGRPNPVPNSNQYSSDDSSQSSDQSLKPSTTTEYWDEDEFEGLPIEQPPLETPTIIENATGGVSESDSVSRMKRKSRYANVSQSYIVEIVCGSFLIMFVINYFTGKRENENIALAWVSKFAVKDSIFDKNFSLVGVDKDENSPLLLKEGQNLFKFFASGRRFCHSLLATIELKNRHDLISRLFHMFVRSKDEIKIEVYMNDDAMDQVVFALAKKKAVKTMQKEVPDLQRFASLVSTPPGTRKWVAEDLVVVSEFKEVAGDLITDTVIEQVFGDKAFEKYGKSFISMHFSDQHAGMHKKVLVFKFSLPDANHMAEMTPLVALVPYYIDLIGRYKISPQVRTKTEASRQKAAHNAYKELQNSRQDRFQKKKGERRKLVEESEAKLSAEAIRKKEAKERSRLLKKTMPKVKMTRAG